MYILCYAGNLIPWDLFDILSLIQYRELHPRFLYPWFIFTCCTIFIRYLEYYLTSVFWCCQLVIYFHLRFDILLAYFYVYGFKPKGMGTRYWLYHVKYWFLIRSDSLYLIFYPLVYRTFSSSLSLIFKNFSSFFKSFFVYKVEPLS